MDDWVVLAEHLIGNSNLVLEIRHQRDLFKVEPVPDEDVRVPLRW